MPLNTNEYSAEILDLTNPPKNCQNLPPYPGMPFRSMGGLDKNSQPVICGGLDANSASSSLCYTLIASNGTWVPAPLLTGPRAAGAYTQVVSSTNISILVAGGSDYYGHFTCSVEALNTQTSTWTTTLDNSHTQFAPLPRCVERACMTQLNSTQIVFTGGYALPSKNSNSNILSFIPLVFLFQKSFSIYFWPS